MRARKSLSKVGMLSSGGLAVLLLVAGSATAQDGDWSTYNYDSRGSRFNQAETILGVSNVGDVEELWRFEIPDAGVSGTPAVAGGVVYAGDSLGRFYALSAADGSPRWMIQLSGPITASALVTGRLVIIGVHGNFVESGSNLYGLNRRTGEIEWVTELDPHPVSAIYGSATKVRNYVAVGVASNEEAATGDPGYPCCTTRGSLVLVDPRDGAVIWQTFTVSEPVLLDPPGMRGASYGPSGATIWSTPTFDDELNLIYATTGNNFSEPTSDTSDAILAFDAKSGAIVWSNQRTEDDLWNFRFPFSTDHPDFDFGDSAQVYTLSDGRKVVGAGQKSGFYHVLDAATGEEAMPPVQLEPGGLLGGLFADSAVADGVIYANGIDWPDPLGGGFPVKGDLFALSADTLDVAWSFQTPFSPNITGVAVANGVVYFQSLFANQLYALDAGTGELLLALPVGASMSGPAVSNGRIYLGTGDAFLRFSFPGGIVALGLP